MTSDDRKQDTWFVSVAHQNSRGLETFSSRGILDLPHPMTAFDASGYALAIQVRDTLRDSDLISPEISSKIHVVIWGKRRPGLHPGRYQVCGGLAEYDAERDSFMRPMPWINEWIRKEIGSPEGAVFHPLDWK